MLLVNLRRFLPTLTTVLFAIYVINVIVGKISLMVSRRFKPWGIPDKWSALLLFTVAVLFALTMLQREAIKYKDKEVPDLYSPDHDFSPDS